MCGRSSHVVTFCLTMISLPTELYRDITEHIEDDAELLSLLRVCSIFRAEAQRRLFKTVRLGSGSQHTPTDKLALSWLSSPAVIGRFVIKLDLIKARETDTQLVKLMQAAYHWLFNLEELILPRMEMGYLIPPAPSPFKLWHFCSGLEEQQPQVFIDKMLPFLESQPSIRELDLSCDIAEALDSRLLPNLSILSARFTLVFHLLSGRQCPTCTSITTHRPPPSRRSMTSPLFVLYLWFQLRTWMCTHVPYTLWSFLNWAR